MAFFSLFDWRFYLSRRGGSAGVPRIPQSCHGEAPGLFVGAVKGASSKSPGRRGVRHRKFLVQRHCGPTTLPHGRQRLRGPGTKPYMEVPARSLDTQNSPVPTCHWGPPL